MSKGVRPSKPLFIQQSLFPEEIPLPPTIYNNDVQIGHNQYFKDGNIWKQTVNRINYEVVAPAVIAQLENLWREQNMLPGAKSTITQ